MYSKYIRASSLCLLRDSVTLSGWADGKTKDIINCLYITFKAEARDYGKGRYISDVRCGVRPITMPLCQLANQSRLQEGLLENDAFERGGV